MESSPSTNDGVQVIEAGDLTWVNISSPDATAARVLKDRYPFLLDIDLENILPPFQRPKILTRDDYLFMVLLFPVYDPKTRMVRPTEVDFFVAKDFVITSHTDDLPGVAKLSETCLIDEKTCRTVVGEDPAKIMYSVLHELQGSVFPIVTRLTNDLIDIEREVFDDLDHGTIKEILRIKSNIVQCRQAMQGHKLVLKKFIEAAEKFFDTRELEVFYEDLMGHSQEIWAYLQNDKETIDAIYESHLSLVTYNTNTTMKKLASLSLIVFPTTLVAAIFAMSAENMPIKGHQYDFWIMLALVATMMATTLAFLRRKHWL